jgi:hypothetical protein
MSIYNGIKYMEVEHKRSNVIPQRDAASFHKSWQHGLKMQQQL